MKVLDTLALDGLASACKRTGGKILAFTKSQNGESCID